MIFNTPIFLIFFVLFLLAYIAIGGRLRWSLRLLIVASLVFYAAFDIRFVPLLLGTSLLDFFFAQRIERDQAGGRDGRRWMLASLFVNLGVLGYFKYTNFFLQSTAGLARFLGWSIEIPHLDIILPVGISFYTFANIAYTVDVYSGGTHARRDLTTFLAAVTFFPKLVLGPITRPSDLLPQLERGPTITATLLKTGIFVFACGLFKKTVADLIAPIATTYFSGTFGIGRGPIELAGNGDLIGAWTGILGIAAQLYGDFSGYTDMAIGLAMILGYELPPNFNLPFLATSPADYWRRWHISLSTWLRDYVFFPVSRWRPGAIFLPIMVTLTVSGVWHGAAWAFVLWGVYLGLVLYLTQLASRRWRDQLDRVPTFLKVAFTFYTTVILAFPFFQAKSLGVALLILRDLHVGSIVMPTWEQAFDLAAVVVALVVCHGVDWLSLRKREVLLRPWVLIPLLFLLFWFAFSLGNGEVFLYVKF